MILRVLLLIIIFFAGVVTIKKWSENERKTLGYSVIKPYKNPDQYGLPKKADQKTYRIIYRKLTDDLDYFEKNNIPIPEKLKNMVAQLESKYLEEQYLKK